MPIAIAGPATGMSALAAAAAPSSAPLAPPTAPPSTPPIALPMPGCSASLVGTFANSGSAPGTSTCMLFGDRPTARRLPTARSADARSKKMPTVGVILSSLLHEPAGGAGGSHARARSRR